MEARTDDRPTIGLPCECCGGALLSGRQIDIVQLVADGHGHKEIAYRLGISTGTVKVYISMLYDRLEKLGVRTAAGEPIRSMPALAVWWVQG